MIAKEAETVSFLKKLFGGGASAPASHPTQEHRGWTITAHPVPEGGQHRVSGTLAREIDGVRREKRFERSDRLASRDEAVDMTFQKGRLMIDQLGDRALD
jgi:hypothetical protein